LGSGTVQLLTAGVDGALYAPIPGPSPNVAVIPLTGSPYQITDSDITSPMGATAGI
jgi:hypothetical protein